MYKSIYYDRETRMLYIWDDKKGLIKSQYNNYAYIKSPNGTSTSLYGDSCQRITYWTQDDVKKGLILESDIPIETKALIDNYKNDDTISEGHKEVIFDIEVEAPLRLASHREVATHLGCQPKMPALILIIV